MADKKKESFLLYDSYKSIIDMMTDEQAGQLIKAIFAFETGESVPDLEPALLFAFQLIADRLEKDNTAYSEKCKKNTEIAKKREASRKSTNVHERDDEKDSTNVHERAQTYTNVHERHLYDSDSDNDSDSESIKSATHSYDYQRIVDAYNDTCQSLPQVQKLTDERKRKIKARLAKYSEADLQTAFDKINKSDFARSANWCSFDWIVKSDGNLAKILEGNYDNKDSPPAVRNGAFNSFEEFQKAALGGRV